MPWNTQAPASQLLSPCSRAHEPKLLSPRTTIAAAADALLLEHVLCNTRSHRHEACTPQLESQLPTLHNQRKTQHNPQNKLIKIFCLKKILPFYIVTHLISVLKKIFFLSIRGGNTNKWVKIHECPVIEKLYPLILQLYKAFYFDYPGKKSDPFRMGFRCIFLPCFAFVIKAFPAASPPLSGKPEF